MKPYLKATVAMLTLVAGPAVAQPAAPAPNSALETLGAMRPTGSTADWPEIPLQKPIRSNKILPK